ncbi:MAG TPA: alpha/beta fold hydrolase [Solirubrobacteraceae bacterium]|nr:alpha/beta fold hydrolase [Solirubrobacteraceae bacterium]
MTDLIEPREVTLHGRSLTYVQAGSGPVLLLIHGVAGTLENWRGVIGPLSQQFTVVASDLPGHGKSGPGAGDYSLGAMAAGLRDLLLTLGHERATVVGHSLGGGIAMQFSYQFPEMTERLVLVSSGGLGTEVSALLRAATLPGSGPFIAGTAALGRAIGQPVGRVLSIVGRRPSADLAEVARGYGSLVDRDRRAAFLATLRGVVGAEGQRVHAGDRLYLAEGLPVLIVWGSRDPIIPVQHAESAHEAMPGSRLEIFDGAGHLPQIERPERFVSVLSRFMAETEAVPFDPKVWRSRLRPADPGRSP